MLNISQCGVLPVTIVLEPVPACQFSATLHKCKSSHWESSHQAKGLCLWWLSSVMQGKDPLCPTPVKSTNTHLLRGRGGNGSSSSSLHWFWDPSLPQNHGINEVGKDLWNAWVQPVLGCDWPPPCQLNHGAKWHVQCFLGHDQGQWLHNLYR